MYIYIYIYYKKCFKFFNCIMFKPISFLFLSKKLLALALALVLVEFVFHMTTAAPSANMKDLQITTNLPCLMVTQKCSLGGNPRCIVTL